ncbi:MAG: 2-C-methyl-D-erythritol 4-phosphate cytidylyltransferase [Clostridia bacterium]|nr:2-C-methyl-D-erythritol 4-phosphate cytidylyltransferase [Clostridia bacterium]
MIGNKKVTAIVLAAGDSMRYGKNRNKNFEILNGKTVLQYSIDAFDKNNYIDDIIIASKENEIQKVKNIISEEKHDKIIKVIIGGKTRKESVYHCITSTNADIVIIHDGARPLIKQEYINQSIECIGELKGVTIGVKAKDTIKIADKNNVIISTTNRSNTWIIQTPQCFNRDVLVKLHEKYKNVDVTDDCSLLEKEGYSVKIVEGDYTNIKITTYEDWRIIESWLSQNR